MDELNDQIEQRLKKLDRLRSLGIEPFGAKFDVKDRAGDVIARHGTSTKEALEQQRVTATVAGRVIALRRFGKAAFASIQDGIDTIQVYLKKDLLGESGYALAELLDIGDWTRARLARSRFRCRCVSRSPIRCPRRRPRICGAVPASGSARGRACRRRKR